MVRIQISNAKLLPNCHFNWGILTFWLGLARVALQARQHLGWHQELKQAQGLIVINNCLVFQLCPPRPQKNKIIRQQQSHLTGFSKTLCRNWIKNSENFKYGATRKRKKNFLSQDWSTNEPFVFIQSLPPPPVSRGRFASQRADETEQQNEAASCSCSSFSSVPLFWRKKISQKLWKSAHSYFFN